jgi:hypothetical protein
MTTLANLFLRARAWQLFVFLFLLGLPPAVIMARLSFSMLKLPFAYTAGTGLLFTCVAFWLWSLGDFLDSQMTPSLRQGADCFVYP